MNIIENLSRVFQEKQHMKRLSFITQFKIEFLLLFTGWRQVLGKMPELLLSISWNWEEIIIEKWCKTLQIKQTNILEEGKTAGPVLQKKKKGQDQINWKRHYIFNLRTPYFCAAIGSMWYSWGVRGAPRVMQL